MPGLLSRLPSGMSEDDLIGILKLALLTESATESYEATICACADRFEAPWLRRFVERVWSPDEATHFAPYKLILLNLGLAEAELDREIKETRERQYVHYGGSTPVHMTTFGMIQEYLTDSYHGLIGKLLKGAAPQAAAMAMRIKRRETLHCVWYRDMTALQVEADPRFVVQIVSEIDGFHMPGMSLVPELQAQAPRWQKLLDADSEQIFRDLFRFVHETLGSVRLTGELVLRLGAEKNIQLGLMPARLFDAAVRRLGGAGHGIIGEAALERWGLGYMFARKARAQNGAFQPYENSYQRIRSLLRSLIASQLPSPDLNILDKPAVAS